METIFHEIDASIELFKCSNSLIDFVVIDNLSIEVVSLRVEEDGGIAKISERVQKVLEVEWQLCRDIVMTKDVLQDKHERHDAPAEPSEQQILANAPKNLNDGRSAVAEAACRE